jgi:two-component system response regulator YesN
MKILVIDDESLIREAVIQHLQKVGVTHIYEAENGIEGFNQIQALRPDLIIADIRMPGMSGLELLAKLKDSQDETLFVLLTGYDRFEYVQTALNLGAFSYLLKPFSTEQFEELVYRTEQILQKQSLEHETHLQMRIKMNQGALWMKRRFIEELVTQKSNSENYIRNKLGELDIRFDYDSFCVLTVCLDRYSEWVQHVSPSQIDLIKYSMDNIASEILSQLPLAIFSFDTEDGLSLLINYSAEHIAQEDSSFVRLSVELKDCIFHFLRHEVTIGIGSSTPNILNLNHAYETSKQAVTQRLIKGGNRVFYYDSPEVIREKFKVLSFKTEQEMLSAFEICDPEAALTIIQELYTPFFSIEFVDQASLLKLNFQLILLIYKILERLDINPMEILGEELTLYEEINQYNHIDAIILRFGDLLRIGFEAVLQAREKGNKKIIEKARQYIHDNYSHEISLESVAEHIHITPTYLSSIFKREINENFVDYVSNYRVEKAKQLLREGNLKVNVIAGKVGISNVKYFYKVFKKRTGLTPSEYKDI